MTWGRGSSRYYKVIFSRCLCYNVLGASKREMVRIFSLNLRFSRKTLATHCFSMALNGGIEKDINPKGDEKGK